MFQTELLLQKKPLKQGGAMDIPVVRTLKPGSLDVKQQIEVKSQREAVGSDGG